MTQELFFGLGIGFVAGAAVGAALVHFFIKKQSVKLQTDISAQMSNQFELLAAKIMEDKGQKISEQNNRNLSLILDPLKERLKDFERKVEETYSTERAERGNLRGELSKLMELNFKMSSEAENLTRALKGDVKTQGNWGELILENILDRSGLRRGEEFIVQGTDLNLKNDEGQIIRPDVIINLPEGKHLIIDSKVSLVAYESYAKSTTTEDQERWGKMHVESLKRHIDGLSAKKYQTSEKLITPDFVMLFMPIEPAFALAFRMKPDLLQYAWDRNIAMVSPTTLLTTLRTVASIWKQELRKKNAEEIAARGGLLYDKFVGLIEDLGEVGKKMEAAQKAHESVVRKVSEGSGNLVSQVEKLRELGAKSTKRLPLRDIDT